MPSGHTFIKYTNYKNQTTILKKSTNLLHITVKNRLDFFLIVWFFIISDAEKYHK